MLRIFFSIFFPYIYITPVTTPIFTFLHFYIFTL